MTNPPSGTTKILLRTRFWNWIKAQFGETAVVNASLDASTVKMQKDMLKKKEATQLAVAEAFNQERQLKEKHDAVLKLRAQGTAALNEGKEDEAKRIAEQISELEGDLPAIMESFKAARESADNMRVLYENASENVNKRLKETKDLKAMQVINRQRQEIQDSFSEWNDDSSTSQFDDIKDTILREKSRLDAGDLLSDTADARTDLKIRQSDKARRTQATLDQMRTSAINSQEETAKPTISIIDQAAALLEEPTLESLTPKTAQPTTVPVLIEKEEEVVEPQPTKE